MASIVSSPRSPLLGGAFHNGGRVIVSGEGPPERQGDLLIVIWNAEQAVIDLGKRGAVVRREDLAVDREEDLDLIEPTGVDGRVDKHEARPPGAEARARSASRTAAHDSGSVRVARPSPYDSFIRNTSPV